MKEHLLLCLVFFSCINHSTGTLVDGIITMSWSPAEPTPIIDRFLTNNSQIQLKLLCREPTMNASEARQLIKKKLYSLDKTVKDTLIKISGRIGRVVGCLPLQADLVTSASVENKDVQSILQASYDKIWKEMEQRTFVASQINCDYTGAHLNIEEYSRIIRPSITPAAAAKYREKQMKNNKKVRRAMGDNASPLVNGVRLSTGTLLTWGEGYYLIEMYAPEITGSESKAALDVDVIVSIKNNRGGYITADEHPALVFYAVMCVIYALLAILWFVWCSLYWRELMKIQFWIGGVILIGMIEKSAFIAEYDTLNRSGYKVYYAIITAEILSCLKRTVSRMLVVIVALGYGIVKPRLGPLKQKIFGMGLLYFAVSSIEAILRINIRNDETNNKVFIARIPVAIVDAIMYYWIFAGLVATTRQLRLKKNLAKLNVYRHFTNTILFAIVASLLFMIWSFKSHYFTTCVTNWRDFWIDDAFWHILFSIILLVIMILFRPSNNNQRYASVPLLDHSDNENDEFADGDDDRSESAVFDSIIMRKATNVENGASTKNKKQQQQILLNREANVSNSGTGNPDGNGAIEDALTWVEANIPTSIADQALQALDSEDEIVNIKLQRSKMQ